MNRKSVISCGHDIAVSGPFGKNGLPNVVFLHGITGTVDFWEQILPDDIRNAFRWAAVSLPFHYPSTPVVEESQIEITEDTFSGPIGGAIRELFNGEPVHIVGWSTGGFSALMIASRYPELVTSVCSISGFVRGEWGNSLGMMQRVAGVPCLGVPVFVLAMKLLARSRTVYRRSLLGLTAGLEGQNCDFTDSLESFRREFAHHDFSRMAGLFAAIRKIDASGSLGNVRTPVLIIGGLLDTVVSKQETRHIASLLSNADSFEIAGCGHLFYCEAPEVIWPRVNHWISQHND